MTVVLQTRGKVMQTIMFLVMLIVLSASSLFAENIDTKMQKIREAPPQERVHLMNALKREIASMNRQQRDETINALRFQAKTNRGHEVKNEQFQNLQHNLQQQNASQKHVGAQHPKAQGMHKMKPQR